MGRSLMIDTQDPLKVLFVGNGFLLLGKNGTGWPELLRSLNTNGRTVPGDREDPERHAAGGHPGYGR